jgi:alpha-ribazole phosphatase
MVLHLIRHTRTQVDAGICVGRIDVDVASTFAQDSEEVLQKVKASQAAIFCSPAQRCQRLAQVLAARNAKTFVLNERLQELDFGRWQGLPWASVPQEELDAWMADFVSVPAGGGECFLDLVARATDLLAALRASGKSEVLAVTHAGFIKAALVHALGADPRKGYNCRIDFGSTTTLRTIPGCTDWEVVGVNR